MKSEDEIDRALRRLVHGHVTLERAGAAYAEQSHLSPNTRAAAFSFLRGAGGPLARLEIAELSAGKVEQWLDRMAGRGVPATTRESYWKRLRALVRFAAAREWIGRSPWGPWRPVFRGKGRVREREAVRDLEELAALFDGARDEDDERARRGLLPDVEAKIASCACLGIRQGELAGLRWTDVRAADGLVLIARQWDGDRLPKGRRKTELTAAPALFELLERHRETLRRAQLYTHGGPVFPNVKESEPGRPRAYRKGECLTRRILRAVVRRAHLPNAKAWSPQSLRDTFATLEERTHDDLRTLAQRTRHSSLASLLRYLRSARREPPPPGFSLPPGRMAVHPALAAPPRDNK
ncbi:MAG: tyrosine-type recombinase/integrase [Gaiellaceae bacterium]